MGDESPAVPDPAAAAPAPASTTNTGVRYASVKPTPPAVEKMLCERCGVEMYRMHAVWRCPGCGFKTDCCGW
jgi:rubrerythrin